MSTPRTLLTRARTRLIQAWMRWRRPMTLGVRVIATDAQGRVMLVRHTYTPGWHLPGGGVERGESAVAAAIKELREETGLMAQSVPLLVSVHDNGANFPNDHVLVFRARDWTQGAANAAGEIAEAGFFPLDTLPDGITAGTRRRLEEVFEGADRSERW